MFPLSGRVGAIEYSKVAQSLLWKYKGRKVLLDSFAKLNEFVKSLDTMGAAGIGEGLPMMVDSDIGKEIESWRRTGIDRRREDEDDVSSKCIIRENRRSSMQFDSNCS